jgi:hypothetical protein
MSGSQTHETTSYRLLMARVVASVAADKAGTIESLAAIHADLVDKAHGVSERLQGGETIPFDEALDVECLSTHAAASNLLCEAHDRADPLVFAEAQLRAEAIAGMLDQTVEAYREGEAQRLLELRDNVGIALEAFAGLVRGA